MFKKSLVFLSILVVLGLVLFFSPALAKPDNGQNIDLPEKEGVYNVKGHPEMKLRVFVHHVKPTPSPVLSLSCDIPDPKSTAEVDGAGWKLSTATPWVYWLNTSSVPSSVGAGNLSAIANNAYGVWLKAVSNEVTITRGGYTFLNRARFDGKNIIAWGRAPASALAVSYIWYYTSTGLAAEVDTIMNQKFPWAWSDPASWAGQTDPGTTCAYQNVYDVQDILTHELGHTMGLDDEYTSEYQNNTMYGYGSAGETKKNTLTEGDVSGVLKLY